MLEQPTGVLIAQDAGDIPDLPFPPQLSPDAAAIQVICDVFAFDFIAKGVVDFADDGLFGGVVEEGFDGASAVLLFEEGELGGRQRFGAGDFEAIRKLIEAVPAVGDVAGEFVVVEEFAHLFAGAVADFFAFPFGDGKHDGEDEAADMALGGDGFAAEIDDVKADAVLVAVFKGTDAVADVAAEAVEFGDDEVLNVAGGETVHEEFAAVALANGDGAGGVGVAKDEMGTDGEEVGFEFGVFEGAAFLEFEGVVLFVGGDAAIDGGGLHRWLTIGDG